MASYRRASDARYAKSSISKNVSDSTNQETIKIPQSKTGAVKCTNVELCRVKNHDEISPATREHTNVIYLQYHKEAGAVYNVPCYSPVKGYRSAQLTKNGKRKIVFNREQGFVDLPVTIPCGQCIGCRLEKSRQWAIRCVHEASLYENNCFITLTYSPENLPEDGSLKKKISRTL